MEIRTSYKNIIVSLILVVIVFGLVIYKDVVKTVMYPVYNIIIGKGVEKAIDTYAIDQDESYTIYYSGEGIEFDKLQMGKYGDRVFEFFEFGDFRSVDIIVHDDRYFFHNLIGVSLDRPTYGAYLGGKINILYDDTELIPNIFVHELTHYVIDDLAKGNYPTWFTEGAALYMEYYLLGYEWGEELGCLSHISIADLHNRFDELDEYIAYRRSFEIVRDIIDRYGVEQFNQFLRELGKGKNFIKVFEQYYHIIIDKY